MSAVKQDVKEMIQNLPDDCTYEDIQYHIYVKEKIEKSLQRVKKEGTFSEEEASKMMQRWLLS